MEIPFGCTVKVGFVVVLLAKVFCDLDSLVDECFAAAFEQCLGGAVQMRQQIGQVLLCFGLGQQLEGDLGGVDA